MTHDEISINEKRFINKMVEILAAEGWQLTSVYDGEEYEPCTTGDEAYAVCESVDESSVRFTKGDRDHGVLIILHNGNDGYHLVSDYNYSETDDFKDAMDKFDDWLSIEEDKHYAQENQS